MKQQQFVFGWVASNIQSNFAAWSSWKSTGSEEDAQGFWKKTVEEATEQGLEWFQTELED